MTIEENALLIGGRSAESLLNEFGSPLYVYEAETIRDRFRALRSAIPYLETDFHYACKANTNLTILRLLRDEGALLDAVSPGEAFLGLKAGFTADDILFTGNNVTDEEMRYLRDLGILINIDSLSQLERYGRLAPKTAVSVRVNPDVGSGHHDHCITGGPKSKFGVALVAISDVLQLADRYQLEVVGVHAHVGSGILDPEPFMAAVDALLGVVRQFPRLSFVDFGGGFGIPYSPEQHPLDLNTFGANLTERFNRFCRTYGRPLRLKLEPGRFLVGESGVLLTRCNTLKRTPERTFVGVDSGFHHLIRYPLYNAYHEIVNASNVKDITEVYDVCGQICESSDFFARERPISRVKEGDILAVLNVGAYGFAMSSNYNSRARPAEVLIDGGVARVIRQRETMQDLLRGQMDDHQLL